MALLLRALLVLLALMVKITMPTKLKWRPGQHFFVRFLGLGIHAASSHPFTVATLSEQSEGKEGAVMEIYARVHGGITARLATLAKKGAAGSSRVLLDGPYGGIEGNLKAYDRVLLLAGGWALVRAGREDTLARGAVPPGHLD